MYSPGTHDPISVYYRVDHGNNIYAGILHTTILMRIDHGGKYFTIVCRHCLEALHVVSEKDSSVAGGTGLRCWGPQSRSKGTCIEVAKLKHQAKLGLDFYPTGMMLPRASQGGAFPKALLEAYTQSWPIFEQTFALMELEADIRAAVPEIHRAIERQAQAEYSLFEKWLMERKRLNVNAVLGKLEKAYYPVLDLDQVGVK